MMLPTLLLVGIISTPTSSSPVDLTLFEGEVLPRWIKGFQIAGTDGKPIEGLFRDSIDKVLTSCFGASECSTDILVAIRLL